MKKKSWLGMALSGLAAGAVAGLFGAGGGMVLVPLLTLLTPLEETEVFPSSITIILPICLVTLAVSAAVGTVPWQDALPYLFGSAAGGWAAGMWGRKIPVKWLHRGLGILILWGGYRYLCLESLPVALIVGTVLGFLTGLGVGGGSLLILWLTLVLEMPQTAARGINLLFFLPSAMIACYLRWKQGAVTLRKVLPAIFAGCAAAAVFSLISTRMDLDILKKLFGVLLLATGIRELCYRSKS